MKLQGNWDPHTLQVRYTKEQLLWKTGRQLHKVTHSDKPIIITGPNNLTPSIDSGKLKTFVPHTDFHTKVYSIIAHNWPKLRASQMSIGRGMDMLWYLDTECCSAATQEKTQGVLG